MAEELEKAAPMVQIMDVWPRGPDPLHLAAYRACIDSGLIRIIHVTVDPDTHYTIVRYLSSAPEDWTHETMTLATQEDLSRFLEAPPGMPALTGTKQMRMEM